LGSKNAKTGMAHDEMKQFIRNHFEEFVNRQNLGIADVNFATNFVAHGELRIERLWGDGRI
jgi:hypothetical protein